MNTTSSSATTTETSTESLTNMGKRFIAHMLASDSNWTHRAITVLYGFQTCDEQEAQSTSVKNGAGFNGTDAFILSSFAEQIAKGRTLSPKQLAIAQKKLPKYNGQILGALNPEKLDAFLMKASVWAQANPPAPKPPKDTKAE